MWTRWNPFRTLHRALDLWERQIQATEQTNRLAIVNATAMLPASITAGAIAGLAEPSKSTARGKLPTPNEKRKLWPPKKLDANSVQHVTRQSRIDHQIRLKGRALHGDPPMPTATTSRPPSGSTDAD